MSDKTEDIVKFPHIGQFHQAVRTARHCGPNGEGAITSPVHYEGTVKLHGTNAGVVCTPDALLPQSRTRRISVSDDNAGFAAFVAGEAQTEALRRIEAAVRFIFDVPPFEPVTIYGEWCGQGIMKGCAVHNLDRMFVVLGVYVAGEFLDFTPADLPEARIWSIRGATCYSLTVDFTDPISVSTAATFVGERTSEVEDACPWGRRFGVEGVGEGIVWRPLGEHWGRTDLWFKTKGERHKGKTKRPPKVGVDPEVLRGVAAYVEHAVTPERLQQGLDYLAEQGIEADVRATGKFIGWICADVARECADVLEASGLTGKQVSGAVVAAAREFYLATVTAL